MTERPSNLNKGLKYKYPLNDRVVTFKAHAGPLSRPQSFLVAHLDSTWAAEAVGSTRLNINTAGLWLWKGNPRLFMDTSGSETQLQKKLDR